MQEKCVSISVSGKVQNVGFRYHTRDMARKYQLKGFVRNMPDGTVYIEAQGQEAALRLLEDWCQKGPMWARVREIKINALPVGAYSGFEIR